ncbi:MAG: hypothetical protein PVJ98_07870, partial [Akkermansiaceae bacterium]
MEQPPDPYQTPAAGAAAPAGMPPQRSAIPKVMGILHIIYAAIALIAGLIGLGSRAILQAIFDPVKEEIQKSGEDASAVTDVIDSILSTALLDAVTSILLAILLLVSGIQLIRYKSGGR